MQNVFSLVKEDLLKLEGKFVEYLLTPNKPTNQILEHIFSNGGKRLRPALFLLCCALIEYEGEFKFSIAAVCEYIHTASLLHDDVIDNSTLRRNKPTVNSTWGDETAVLAGDLVFSAACRLMVKTQHLGLIDCFAECIRSMSEGELFQLELLWNYGVNVEQYEKLIYGKTAILFEASCKTPGFLKQSDSNVVDALAKYGRNLGYAFQIADDCLDYEGEEHLVGKPVATDLIEGKTTLPLIYALQNDTGTLHRLAQKISDTGEASLEEKQQLVHLVKENGGLAKALQKGKDYAAHAQAALTELLLLFPEKERPQKEPLVQALTQLTHLALTRKN